jgi:hypothetical protein
MIQQAIKSVRILLPERTFVTYQQIEDAVDEILVLSRYKSIDKKQLIREIESIYNIGRADSTSLENKPEPWLLEKETTIEWRFWRRYEEYLRVEKNYSDLVIFQLEKDVNKTLDKLFDPTTENSQNKYGLVVGQVQSGKTSNYTGLICKAADAGFKLIIVLAGVHNNLRSQTQLRLDEGFLGFDTEHQRAFDQNGIKIGVGKIDNKSIAHSLTSSQEQGDFNAGAANALGINFNTNEPIIAVIKKQKDVLPRIIQWLSAQAESMTNGSKLIRNKSILLIDDEADNASINTKPENDEATTINRHIRSILRLFDTSAYIGYTATPFANIFIPIEEDQLFPRDFILNIPAPTNYIGPDKIFGISIPDSESTYNDILPIVQKVEDYQALIPNGHKKKGALPVKLPDSLILAIKSFIITCAIRRLRGQTTVHNSMLIHVSRFTNWQNHIKSLIENNNEGVFPFYRRGIELNIPSIIEELRQVFEVNFTYENRTLNRKTKKEVVFFETYKSYKTVSEEILRSDLCDVDSNIVIHKWEDVKLHLYEAVRRIQVKEINGGSGEVLDYINHRNGLSVIAIGGDKLSRGLTLEGLSVSYYLRASRMYDTLMQMGRWFGYRPGYVDLCRLFTSRELNEWFCHITLASEELRNEFNYMTNVAGSTPAHYAIKVRTHPGVLQISASNKIRRAEFVDVSWAGRLIESYQLQKNASTIKYNYTTTLGLIGSILETPEIKSNCFLWKNINSDSIKSFLQEFKVADNLNNKVNPLYLLDFINVCNHRNELMNWNIAVMTTVNKTVPHKIIANKADFEIGLIKRNDSDNGKSEDYKIRKNHIIDPKDEFVDLDEVTFSKALFRTRETNKEYKQEYPKGEIVRNEFRNGIPLLLIYFLNPEGANISLVSSSTPIVGFAISFPKSNSNPSVRYAVHKQLLPQFNINDEIENDNNDED